MDQDVLTRLNEINAEMKDLGELMLKMRYEDFKGIFCEQLKRAVEDYSDKSIQPELCALAERSTCSLREQCMPALKRVVEEAVDALQRDDPGEALRILEELEAKVSGPHAPCRDGDCTAFALRLIAQAQTTVRLFESIRENVGPVPSAPASAESEEAPPSDEIARLIDPLAHPKRLDILRVLSAGDHGFAEISRAVGLRTGHLQFHLRPLVEAGYVQGRHRGHVYVLTARGRDVLSGLDRLVRQIGAKNNGGAGTEI